MDQIKIHKPDNNLIAYLSVLVVTRQPSPFFHSSRQEKHIIAGPYLKDLITLFTGK